MQRWRTVWVLLAVVALASCGGKASPAASGRHTVTAVPAPTTAPPPTTTPSTSTPVATGPHTVLPPAPVRPVLAECTQSLVAGPDETATPLRCANGGLNTAAWRHYAADGLSVMSLGTTVTSARVTAALCADLARTNAAVEYDAYLLSTAYYGWKLPAATTSVLTSGCSTSQSATVQNFNGETAQLQQELRAGTLPGARRAVADAELTCPSPVPLTPGSAFGCHVSSASVGNAVLLVEVTANGPAIQAIVGTYFPCGGLPSWQSEALANLGQRCAG